MNLTSKILTHLKNSTSLFTSHRLKNAVEENSNQKTTHSLNSQIEKDNTLNKDNLRLHDLATDAMSDANVSLQSKYIKKAIETDEYSYLNVPEDVNFSNRYPELNSTDITEDVIEILKDNNEISEILKPVIIDCDFIENKNDINSEGTLVDDATDNVGNATETEMVATETLIDEFENVLTGVQHNDVYLNLKSIEDSSTINDIENILNVTEEDCYNFQELPEVPDRKKAQFYNLESGEKDVIKEEDDNTESDATNIEAKDDLTNTIMSMNLNDTQYDNLETISLTSSYDIGSEAVAYEQDCGYHSSDFEFITEEEAKMDPNEIKVTSEVNSTDSDPESSIKFDVDKSGDNNDSKDSGEDHVIPQGDDFLNLFQGPSHVQSLPLESIHYLENKSIVTVAPLLVQYDGVGFDMRNMPFNFMENDEKHREEVQESVKKILEMYPEDNPKQKRRRRF